MIIEGKHAEVGQGIFISDIQEGSSAEKVNSYPQSQTNSLYDENEKFVNKVKVFIFQPNEQGEKSLDCVKS